VLALDQRDGVEGAVISPRIDYVRRLFEAHDRYGEDAMLAMLPPDVAWRPYDGDGLVCHGVDDLRAFWAERIAQGRRLEPHADVLEEIGDAVIVSGVTRLFAGRGFRESSTFWLFRFEDDLLRSVETFTARADAIAAAAAERTAA
jgi:SnoaL-like domain